MTWVVIGQRAGQTWVAGRYDERGEAEYRAAWWNSRNGGSRFVVIEKGDDNGNED